MIFTQTYDNYKNTFEKYAESSFYDSFKINNESLASKTINEALQYAFLGGGKRLRPVMMLACADYLNLSNEEILPFAFALECIHIHSLIHDDLPALDNDDTRRGKPTIHKLFGESTAILSGDVFLNFAYRHILHNSDSSCLKFALSYLSDCAGINGMLGGQVDDTLCSDNISSEDILNIYKKKTSSLFCASLAIPCILKKENSLLKDIDNFAQNFGLIFQLTDDLIDYKNKKLTETNKSELNYVKVFGEENCLRLIDDLYNSCLTIIDKIPDFSFLKLLLDYVKERKY